MMTRIFKWFLLSSLLLSVTATATSFQELSLEEMIDKAELAFYGVVIDTQVIEREGEPWTQVNFELLEPFRGVSEDDVSLELLFYGGAPPDSAALQVDLMPQFSAGQTVLIFAYDDTYYSPIVGFRQALWREQGAGFVSEIGARLSLGDDNALMLEGVGASPSDVLQALRIAFGVAE